MELDQNTLFFAAGLCSLAVALTILSVWYQNRLDKFLLWGCLGMILLGSGAVLSYSGLLALVPSTVIAFSLMTVGFVFLFVGAKQISARRVPTGFLLLLSIVAIGIVMLPVLLGFVGVGIATFNFVAAFLLYITAKEYGSVYHEAPVPVVGMMTLYLLTAVSFFLCGSVIVFQQQWVMTSLPSNLAEDFNAIMALIGITGIGALSLTFTQSRIARRHANEARTDSLTGLLNRRALYDCLAVDEMRAGDSVIVFDLDAFKSINDSHGHTVGDRVLLEFASIIRAHAGPGAIIARIGGEEFVLILRQTSNVNVLATADKIRKTFASASFDTTRDPFSTTTSAGIAFLTAADSGFETVFRRADAALYRAKDLGRNRICTELQIVA